MFEITPKEQLLKNVRKGLVQPLPNRYPLLNFEKNMIRGPLLKTDESFIKCWVDEGFLFAVYNGSYDLVMQLRNLCENYDLGIPAIEDGGLKNLFTENGVPFSLPDQPGKTLVSGFSKLEISTNTLYFSSEIHPVRSFVKAENLILFGRSSQVESPDNNKYFSDLAIKNDLKVQLPIQYFKRFRTVFLFMEES